MKGHNKIISAVAVLALSAALASCASLRESFRAGVKEASKGSIQTGAWSEDGKTFTNEWSNVKLSLPEGYRALSPEEIEQTVGAGEEVVVNDGNRASYDIAKMRTAYDFIIAAADAGVPNIMLIYENIGASPLTKNLNEGEYFDMMAEQLETMDALNYEATGTETREVAGESCTVGMLMLADGAAFQDYYIRKQDDVMIVLSATYTADTRDAALDVVASIETAA
ncbi:MAG: hypothetical protein LBD92_03905 [Oscillospiraceae bacterium]|jgi:hypothetical protein|nr:hypothetical protein [Oscillospiraceae bacterium]